MYSRFFCRVLRDLGMVDHDEPFQHLLTQGMVLKNGAVMSKSKGNVVDPDDMIAKYGADALRLYIMFVAPPEKEVEWSDTGLEGSFRFLLRVWRFVDQWCETVGGEGIEMPAGALNDAERALRRKTHDTIRRVSVDLDERIHLNTAISALMELVNDLYAFSEKTQRGPTRRSAERAEAVGVIERAETVAVVKEAVESLVLMLSPFVPHMAEELWEKLGHADGLNAAGWPSFDPVIARPEQIVVPVQVNGRLRSRLTVSAEVSEQELRALALADPIVQSHASGKTVKNVVVAKGKLVNVVVS
jgi:leucyl-tRNA synthetase